MTRVKSTTPVAWILISGEIDYGKTYVLALAPLEQSLSHVDQAGKPMTTHDHYGAGEAPRKAEGEVRLDEVEDVANARHGAEAASAMKK